MADTIVVIAAGEMGAGIGKRLSERGARVLTSMKGRSADSKSRAAAAGMQDIASDDEMVAQADFILSVVPPKDAAALAERLKGPLAKAARKPIYVDCNAIAPKSAIRIGEILGASGAPYVDGGIIGGPPGGDYTPSIYVSGKQANDVKRLDAYGLNIRVVKGDIGAASAMKMSYAGITKGVTAIGAALLLGAARAGCAEELKQELFDSQPQLAQRFARQIPAAFPKAYRWVAEMEEIAAFLGDDPAASEMFLGIAKLYARVASGQDKSSAEAVAELADLMSFCSAPAKAGTGG